MNDRIVTVFGGTGFLGRHAVRRLRALGFAVRAAVRHPEQARRMFGDDAGVTAIRADIHDDASVAAALNGAFGAVNAVSLYVESGKATFHSVHVEAAQRVAREAKRAGVSRLVLVSGIGADVASPSLYVRKRAEGELATRGEFPDAAIMRPAVMFGEHEGFLHQLLGLLQTLPVFPMFGRGQTRLQPAHVDDVAEAIARLMEHAGPATHELGGPRVYTYEELLKVVAKAAGITPRLMPFPFAAWHGIARLSELLPRAPVTRNQVELMQVDTVVTPGASGFAELGIAPQSVEEALVEVVRVR
jgi:NADH dehydrogenase